MSWHCSLLHSGIDLVFESFSSDPVLEVLSIQDPHTQVSISTLYVNPTRRLNPPSLYVSEWQKNPSRCAHPFIESDIHRLSCANRKRLANHGNPQIQ
jgi:hypothetical protein